MPNRTRSHQLEDFSRNRLHSLFEEAGWTVEDLSKDYGEDLLVRIFENGNTTPLSFFVQAKATDNLSRYLDRNSNSFRYPLSHAHLTHWERFQEPVILTLWNSQSDITYWTCIQDALVQLDVIGDLKKRKTVRVPIFFANVLNGQSLKQIHNITHARYKRLERETAGSRFLIELLESKLGVKIEYSSDGIVIVERPKKEVEIKFFGRPAEVIEKLADLHRTSHQRAFTMAIEKFLHDVDEHKKTGSFPVLNPITGKVESRQMSDEQLRYYLTAHSED